MQPRHFEAIIFSAKAAVSCTIAALIYGYYTLPGSHWVAAVSAVIVTQPDLHASLKTSLLRVLANLFGAFGGAALAVLIGQPVVAMAIGVLLTGLVCYLLKLDEAMRPAFVAVILVTLAGGTGGTGEWHTSLNRIVGVIIGCVCALAVGFLFDKLSTWFKLHRPDDTGKSGPQE
jgi:uncharacterized membrane protein YgaE (UPF0421/DUF939 family)